MTPTAAPDVVLDDATLAGRARDGDVRAYEQLVLRYQGLMFRLAVRMLADRTEAQDVVQDVFVTAWRRFGQLHEDGSVAGWLYRMTTNRCLNAIRDRPERTDIDPDSTPSPRTDIRPELAAQIHGELAALTTALQQLTPNQRACWLLREVDGLSYAEIAEIVGADSTAVRGRIARARAQLAEEMKPWR